MWAKITTPSVSSKKHGNTLGTACAIYTATGGIDRLHPTPTNGGSSTDNPVGIPVVIRRFGTGIQQLPFNVSWNSGDVSACEARHVTGVLPQRIQGNQALPSSAGLLLSRYKLPVRRCCFRERVRSLPKRSGSFVGVPDASQELRNTVRVESGLVHDDTEPSFMYLQAFDLAKEAIRSVREARRASGKLPKRLESSSWQKSLDKR
jgi:hypothetical protein